MLECCISGGGAGLGNLYILTVVVVMIENSNTSDDIRVDSGFHSGHPPLTAAPTIHLPSSDTPHFRATYIINLHFLSCHNNTSR